MKIDQRCITGEPCETRKGCHCKACKATAAQAVANEPVTYTNQDIDREQARLLEATRAANGWPVSGWRAEPLDLPGNGDDGEAYRGHEAGV